MKKRTWLKQLRLSQRLTQDAVAAQSFIDRGFYAQIESGTRDPSMDVASNIGRTLHFHPQLFFMEGFHQSQDSENTSYTLSAHCDLSLRYTWIWHPGKDLSAYIGKRDDEIASELDLSELIYIKKQVILQGTPLERVILCPFGDSVGPYLVRAEPILNDLGRIIGVYTTLTFMPGLWDSLGSMEPRRLFHGHIVYFYESSERYVDNAVKYVVDSVKHGYKLCLAERGDVFAMIEGKLEGLLTAEQRSMVHHIDSELMFGVTTTELSPEAARDRFLIQVRMALKRGIPIRMWGHIDWKSNEPDIYSGLSHWESAKDQLIYESSYTAVCAYDASQIPASLQTALLRNHEYFMTDDELVISPLYRRKNHILPSLAHQTDLRPRGTRSKGSS